MKVTIEVFGTESANELQCASRFLGDLASTKNEVIENDFSATEEKVLTGKRTLEQAEAEKKRAALEQAEAEAEEAKAKALEEAERKAKADAEKKRVLAEAKAVAKAKAEEEAAAKAAVQADIAKAQAKAKAEAEAKAQAEADAMKSQPANADTTDFDNEPETADKPLTVEDCRKVAMIALNRQKKELVKEAFEACDARAFPSLKAEHYQKFIDYLNERL